MIGVLVSGEGTNLQALLDAYPENVAVVAGDKKGAFAFERARQEWPWMGVMNVWYLKRADDREMGTVFAGFRLLDPDFTPRPVYQGLKERFATGESVDDK